ncbi:hypothetical protein RI844_19500 [Thalassotalea fonticola]|uniref:Sulfotransferase domain-containing protein n=1 Tax=Thalassotalea fonticola TaxID=3065649 RepID=A0ABZ0GPH9_9GAMM|nr:hypothetical protein RI844_19500 [Colwelliaceae bacterium S1-1]
MTKLYIHIGQEKTGTTSLQKFLCENRDLLFRDYGVLYPYQKYLSTDKRAFFNHAKFSGAFLPPEQRSYVNMDNNIDAGIVVESLRKLISRKKPKVIILSSEHFSSRYTQVQIEQLAKMIDFCNVKIISYIRRQDDYQISRFSEALKSGSVHALKLTKLSSSNKRLNYYENLKPWFNTFGTASLILRPFNKNSFANGDLYSDFLSAIGITNIEGFTKPEESNLSISKEEALVLCQLNQSLLQWKDVTGKDSKEKFQRSQQIRKSILSTMQNNRDIKPHTPLRKCFSISDRKEFLASFLESNKKLSTMFFDGKELFEPIE